jgi:hypothetical protein
MTRYRLAPTPLQAIRKKCLECSGGSPKEAANCIILDCDLYPFRLGMNPNRCGIGQPSNLAGSANHGGMAADASPAVIGEKRPTEHARFHEETVVQGPQQTTDAVGKEQASNE